MMIQRLPVAIRKRTRAPIRASTGKSWSARSALCGLCGLALLLCLLPSTLALAATRDAARPTLTTQGIIYLAGVSVVRLSLSYTDKRNNAVTCTELGTLIASWPATSPTDLNNWILTDSAELSLTGGSCAPGGELKGIAILANTTYTNHTAALATLAQLSCTTTGCSDQLAETLSKPVNGGMLLSFHTNGLNMQPFLIQGQAGAASTGIELGNSSDVWPLSPILSTGTPQEYLDPLPPSSAPPTSAPTAAPTAIGHNPTPVLTTTPALAANEPGMPLVDTQGRLMGMQTTQTSGLKTPFSLTNLQGLESLVPQLSSSALQTHLGTNTLNQQWIAGMQAYDAGNYAKAVQDLNVIQDKTKVNNPNFLAAAYFAQQATQKESHGQTGSGNTPPTAPANNKDGNNSILGIPYSLILAIGLAAGVVFLVFLLVLVSIVFGRKRSQRQELQRFKEDAAVARRNAPQEAMRLAERSRHTSALPPEMSAQAVQPPSPPLVQMSPQPPQPYPQVDYATSAPPPPPLPSPEQEVSLDAPTIPYRAKNGNGFTASEGHVVRDLRNVILAVGYQSNVGIKRQHKPNEDSLFAMQGARTHNSQPQQFGLFVVADGMGGHANGQDASRLAIQTMIDFMLPRISVSDIAMDDAAYLKLLEDGVQHANQRVNQRNGEEHADMGTTMTTALVIGSMAYVANVGDSRTYLYRESLGLTKVTRDHSVVMSLVDAGIIKLDDIYTHPKRNQIYRSLGEKPIVEVDSFKVELQPNDKLLLCTDGLWDMVRDPEIQRIISAPEPDPARTGEDLIEAALKGGGEDNVSVIVVSIHESAGHTGLTGIQYLAKPESVTVPDLPPM